MKNTLWNKRIPTLLGIALIGISIGVTTLLVKSGVILVSKASPTETPKNVRITNVSDTTLSMTYTTDASVIGALNFGKDKNFGLTGLDDRDQQSQIAPHTVHHITLKNLSPETTYFFSITSGQNTFLNDKSPFEVTTGPTLREDPPTQEPITGTVILPNGNKPKEAIVYATVEDGQTISSLIKEDGTFTLPLNSLRTTDLSSYVTLSQESNIKLLITNDSLKSNVLISHDTTVVPIVTLSLDYDFTLDSTPIASRSAEVFGFPSFTAQEVPKSQDPQILTPKKDQGFSDQQPLFQGKARPLEKVTVEIHSDENIQTEITTDKFGNWSYRPTTVLSPGSHTLSITTKDASGILRTITQSFTVFAQGSQVTGSATPSATFTPVPTTTLSPSVPVATPTTLPTIILTAVPTSIPQPTLPPTGNSTAFSVGIISLLTSITGIALFLLTRGMSL